MKTFREIFESKYTFSKDLTVYHGTNREFDSFHHNPAAVRQPYTPASEVPGHFFTPDPHAASSYAGHAKRKSGDGRHRVVSATLDLDNPYDATPSIKYHAKKYGLSYGDAKHKVYNSVDRTKHDGILNHGNGMNSPEYVVFDHNKIKMKPPGELGRMSRG